MSFLEITAGIALGLISAVSTLFIFHYVLSPGIRFSQNIRSHWLPTRNRPSYSIKTRNTGLIDLIDTQIHCTLMVRDVHKNNGKLWNGFPIPTSFANSLHVKRGTRIIHLKLHEAVVSDPKQYLYFEKNLKIGRPDVGVRFEDFFQTYKDTYILVRILGHDRFTGVKKLYVSPRYRFHSIRAGRWNGLKLGINFNANHA